MFEADRYRKACSESLRLPEEKLQEMIFMTENKKHGLRKPIQIALIAAALVCMMCITAAAANPEAVRELWQNITMTVTVQDGGDTVVVQIEAPEITVDDVDARTILTINGESKDITDAMAQDGKYVGDWSDGSATGTITVYSDKSWEMDVTLANGSTVHTNSKAGWVSFSSVYPYGEDGESGSYRFTDDEGVTDAIYLPPEE